MSNNPKFLSFCGDMYVRADQFVKPLMSQTFKGGMDHREAVTKVTLADSSWFEVGSLGYKAWPLTDTLVKVDTVKPDDSAATLGEAIFDPQPFIINNGTINISQAAVEDAKIGMATFSDDWILKVDGDSFTMTDGNGVVRARNTFS